MVSRDKPVLTDVLKMLYEGGFEKFKIEKLTTTPFSLQYKLGESVLRVSIYGGIMFEHVNRNAIDYCLRIDNQHGYVALRLLDDDEEHMEMINYAHFDDKMYTEEEYFQLSLVKDLKLSYNEHIELLKYLRMVKLAHPKIYDGKSWPSL